ncbi:hypothetical protein [uncultured Desulfobacter sp.]|uniref:hypothetical protein n=1 Tax=uncultured Desulfobacter sp. TaxID=240139 RepID=UPI002AA67559|nr:hypothetical protein [uncultured Desulfobacter sp.]
MKTHFKFEIMFLFIIFCTVTVAYTETNQCDFDGDGDVDALDLKVFSQKYGTTLWYKDADGDGYSDGETVYEFSPPPDFCDKSDLIDITGDCDDDPNCSH